MQHTRTFCRAASGSNVTSNRGKLPSTTTEAEAAITNVAPPAGWLASARAVPSPNFDARPRDTQISLLVVHAISLPPNEFGGQDIERLFTNSLDHNTHPFYAGLVDLRVSAHLLIRRTGLLTQFVGLAERAWHAGVSTFAGRSRCNDFSIGIELEGCDSEPFTDAQYEALIDVTEDIRRTYPEITPERIVGHADIAPGRKTDPGPCFDWARFRAGFAS